eukprot:7855611-Karenia_brevis.AAC.1
MSRSSSRSASSPEKGAADGEWLQGLRRASSPHLNGLDGRCPVQKRDSPNAILAAGRRAVRNWRFQRIGQAIPNLVPSTCDIGGPPCSQQSPPEQKKEW